jgi:hypothetical protein
MVITHSPISHDFCPFFPFTLLYQLHSDRQLLSLFFSPRPTSLHGAETAETTPVASCGLVVICNLMISLTSEPFHLLIFAQCGKCVAASQHAASPSLVLALFCGRQQRSPLLPFVRPSRRLLCLLCRRLRQSLFHYRLRNRRPIRAKAA